MRTTSTSAPPRPRVDPDLAGHVTLVPAGPTAPAPAAREPAGLSRLWRFFGRPAVWYTGFALYAAGVALLTGPGRDHYWGIWASGAYAVAAGLSWRWPGRRGRAAALAVALAGALAGPVAWMALREAATPDTIVVSRAATLLLHHGTPYLGGAQLVHGGFLAYNPYLPVMAVFGLPHALGLPGLAGDPRPWLAAATFVLLAAAFRIAGRPRRAAWGIAAFALASPVLAFSIAMGITDAPIIALTILAIALAARKGPAWPAAMVLGTACAMKYTAWPALAVLVALLAARDGARAATRFAAVAVGTGAALSAALAPAALAGRSALAALAANTIAYPLGLTHSRSPAQSPLPGHALTTLGPAGHAAAVALLITAGLAIAAWVALRPPATVTAATHRIALGLALLFALCPDTRFGYFAYPLALYGWLALTRPADMRPVPPASP